MSGSGEKLLYAKLRWNQTQASRRWRILMIKYQAVKGRLVSGVTCQLWHVSSTWSGVASRHSTSRSILTPQLAPGLLHGVTSRDPQVPGRRLELLMWHARMPIARGSRGLQAVWRMWLHGLIAQEGEEAEYSVSSLHTSGPQHREKYFSRSQLS